MGGYNFAYSGSGSSGSDGNDGGTPITVSFNDEPLAQAFNFVLLSSGLQAKLEGRTVLVGSNVLMKQLVIRCRVFIASTKFLLMVLLTTWPTWGPITNKYDYNDIQRELLHGVSTANASASTSQTSEQTVIESFGPVKALCLD